MILQFSSTSSSSQQRKKRRHPDAADVSVSESSSSSSSYPYQFKTSLEILQLISQEFSTKDISKELALSPNTVDTHRKNLMRKLQVKNSIGLVKFAIKNNLV